MIAAFVLFGVALGFVPAPITTAAVSGMPRAQAGVASALASTSGQVGTTLGVAISGTIAGGLARGPAFALATRPYWWLVVAGGIAIAILALFATGGYARRSLVAIRSLME